MTLQDTLKNTEMNASWSRKKANIHCQCYWTEVIILTTVLSGNYFMLSVLSKWTIFPWITPS